MPRLPFVGSVFWKTLGVVTVLVIVTWVLILKLSDYEMQPADYGGSAICTVLFSYLVHLWLIPMDEEPEEPADSPVEPRAMDEASSSSD